MTKPTVKFRKLFQDAQLPTYETPGAAGADVRAYITDPWESHPLTTVTLEPGKRRLFSTGLEIEVPVGFEVQVRPRSGLAAKHGITVLNAPGTIDNDYRGPLCIILINTSAFNSMTFYHGDRIAQIVVAPVVQAQFEEVEELSTTERGTGGFGSTGLK